MSAHTPGPWTVKGEDRFSGEIIASDGETHVVCFGHDYNDGGSINARHSTAYDKVTDPNAKHWNDAAYEAEAMANAYLIAAAPDYWDAAEQMSTDASELEGDDAGYVAITKESYDALMAAHAKAEGKP